MLASREDGLQQMAQTFVKGPRSQQGDGKSFLHPRENKARNRWPHHSSKAQAGIKDMINHLLPVKRTRPQQRRPGSQQGDGKSFLHLKEEGEGLQQVAQPSVKGPGSQQGDGKSLLRLKENKVRNKRPKHQSKDQARNKDVVNNLTSQREQGLQHTAYTSVKGPSSQQGDGW